MPSTLSTWGRRASRPEAPWSVKTRYKEGMEDQLSALGFLVNVCVLWNTMYTARALEAIRAEGKRPAAADIARLSPLGFDHIRFLGRYNFSLPEHVRNGQLRPLRTPMPPAPPGR